MKALRIVLILTALLGAQLAGADSTCPYHNQQSRFVNTKLSIQPLQPNTHTVQSTAISR